MSVQPGFMSQGLIEQQPTKFDLDVFGQAYHLAFAGQLGLKNGLKDRLERVWMSAIELMTVVVYQRKVGIENAGTLSGVLLVVGSP